ncbi:MULTISPECIES: helix-turn-helix domain-containing GNAT family N-acetyltransferase [unclassified Lysobacter]|uniref:bifunctional helix-turn-helix transcriptional regulator/GNAT family N-acetyltransferase n=1 Tax=unclassified Lysobacter TaxID=2635362 RepID=UPI0006F33C1F|nr:MULTISPECIES: helix-turn-helix domain-containing GNAT family N-acetyltransferase [unclassified Lysobacter]KQZ67952.1 MarR family transcriptional regulator [Lysobacter sp. Root559]KRA74836.1 MarR family transcriptional regulator [Lysobacter sp. Root667]KRC38278.1 MarR family transcriptional regulator [Lysobacter sp. Root76]KRD69602.1 MarR family transcriptional regulator [Lysobacter sp. Root96]
MTADIATAEVDAVRAFNRFYTRRIGVLQEDLLDSKFPLTQARVLFELAQREPVAARAIGDALGLDPGYLSRILQGFADAGLIERTRSEEDARSFVLTLSAQGREAFGGLDRSSHQATAAMLAALSPLQRERLLRAIGEAELALSPQTVPEAQRVVLRGHRIGDIGWAIERHGRLYADEYGWNGDFEALVATLFARFASSHDPWRERCWIAELDGERIGCVFVIRNADDPDAAQLRCLLVDPRARGLGVGRRLVEACLAFAREAGYRRMLLWTNDILSSARHIYERCGFVLTEEERHHSFGHDLVGQVWKLELD